jgi:hypothetical protein
MSDRLRVKILEQGWNFTLEILGPAAQEPYILNLGRSWEGFKKQCFLNI